MNETPLALPVPFTFSQSSLQDYDDCPRRFALRHLQQVKWLAIEKDTTLENERHQVEGQNFHRLVQRHLIGIPAEDLTPLLQTETLERWWTHYLQSEEAGWKNDSAWTLYPEITLSAPFGKHRLLAKYDLLAIHESQKAIIVDWKTYRKRPKDKYLYSRWQTRVYRYLLVEAGAGRNGGIPISPNSIEMRYWFAEYPEETARFPYSEKEYRRDREMLEKIIGDIEADRDFPLAKEKNPCRFCAYRTYCEREIEDASDVNEEDIEGELSLNFDFDAIEEIML